MHLDIRISMNHLFGELNIVDHVLECNTEATAEDGEDVGASHTLLYAHLYTLGPPSSYRNVVTQCPAIREEREIIYGSTKLFLHILFRISSCIAD
jgi:hypothetical protein